jgi:hypothetical protein
MRTIQEMKEAKSKLEKDMMDLVFKFEQDYGVVISDVGIERCTHWSVFGRSALLDTIKVKVEL